MQDVFEGRRNRFLHIDGLRALSIIWMIGFHSVWCLGYFIPKNEYFSILGQQRNFRLFLEGMFGVDVFFTLSGFLISSILLNEITDRGSIQFGRFYIRRFFRIIPAYLTSLLLCRFIIGTAGVNYIWANLFLINNYIPARDQFMGWAWSLAIEEQFYLVFPLFLVGLLKWARRPAFLISLIIFGSLVCRYFVIKSYGLQNLLPFTPFFDQVGFGRWFDNWYDKSHLRGSGILLGVLVAFFKSDSIFRKYVNAYAIRILLILSVIYFIWSITSEKACVFDYCLENSDPSGRVLFETLKHFMISAITAGLIIYCSGPGSRGIVDRFLSSRVWRPFAELSFSAYLLHPIIIVVFYKAILIPTSQVSGSKLIFVTIAVELITFLVSYLMYFIIEAPFRKLGRRIASNDAGTLTHF
ncbi:MAG: acyltransferase [Bdellovibrionia bacterium]